MKNNFFKNKKEPCSEIIEEHECLSIVKKGTLYGVINNEAHLIVPCEFYGIRVNGNTIEVQKTENGEYEPYMEVN